MRKECPQEKIPAGMAGHGNPFSLQMGGFGNPAVLPGDDFMAIRPGDGCQDPDVRVKEMLVDNDEFRRRDDIEPALDRLADIVRSNIDVQRIYRGMGLP